MSYLKQVEKGMAFNDVSLTAKSNILFKSLVTNNFVAIPVKEVPSTFGIKQLSKHFDKGLLKIYNNYCEIHDIKPENLNRLVVISYRADEYPTNNSSGVQIMILYTGTFKSEYIKEYTKAIL